MGATGRRMLLITLTVCAVVFSCICSFVRKPMYNAYGQRYVFFRSQLTNLMYNIWASIIVLVHVCVSPSFLQELRDCSKRLPPWKLVIPALLDGLASLIDSIAGPNVEGSLTVLLGQSAVFFTMLFSFLLLRTRYSVVQILGSITVALGASLAVIPSALGLGVHAGSAGFILLYFSADIPEALSAVYKDFAFKRGNLDVFYLTACVSWVQLVVTWCYLPLLVCTGLAAFTSFDEVPDVFVNGFKCFLGDESVPIYDNEGAVTGYCSSTVTILTFAFSLSGFVGAIFKLYLLKLGSATLYVLTGALATPIADFCFNVPFLTELVGIPPTPFSWYNAAAVALVVVGFAAYSLDGFSANTNNIEDKEDIICAHESEDSDSAASSSGEETEG